MLLEKTESQWISGTAIAEKLGLTRAAVWKCIRQLEYDGYEIETSRRGYRLGPGSDAVSVNSLRRELGEDADVFDPEVLAEVDSTNTYLKKKAAAAQHDGWLDGLRDWHTVIAACQSEGRGRLGRKFVSPPETGLYMSVLLRRETATGQAARITTIAAVAACLAIEACTREKAAIKWVNDIYVHGKKVCGILTEASVNLETGGLDWAVMGIGLNVYEPREGFPEEIREIAGSIVRERQRDLRSRLAAAFLKEFRRICSDPEGSGYVDEYRRRSFLTGKEIRVISGDSTRLARALDVDKECRLRVQYEDGTTETLSSGEVSVRPIRS